MRLSKTLLTAILLALALVAVPAFAADAPAADLDFDALQGAQVKAEDCNQKTCGKNQFCCNYSCSICAPLGGACTQQVCDPIALSFEDTLAPVEEAAAEVVPEPEAPLFVPEAEDKQILGGTCGDNVCGQGEFCCNPSCGVCAPIGGYCLDIYCPPTS